MKRVSSYSLLVLTLLTAVAYPCLAQPAGTSPPQVRLATDDMTPVPARLADLAWIVGAWEGPLGDTKQEHIAYPAIAGQIPGFVRAWTADNAITFYEINAFAEVDGSVEFRVKHFTSDLAGWEPQAEFVRHRLVARTGDTWFFDGITFERTGPNRHTVFYRIPSGEKAGEIITVHQRRRADDHRVSSAETNAEGATQAKAKAQPTTAGEVVTLASTSAILRDNRIGLNPERSHRVYLPPSYAASPERRYPVVYFCHNTFWSPAQMFADGNLPQLLERGFATGTAPELILVGTDFTGPTTGSLYENSTTSGRWLDYLVEEIVPLIDREFRTIARAESRAVIGDFWGGYAALKLAMRHPDQFGSAYAMHPVAAGNGDLPMTYLDVDWPAVHAADSWDALPADGRSRIFTAISQAFLPNADRPPFYCDFPVEMVDGEPRLDPDHFRRMQRAFLLEEQVADFAANLRSLRGLALDWGRFDPTQAHVISNRRLSRQLTDLGIDHEAEEYAGGIWDKTWDAEGRFATRVMPFLGRHLAVTQP